MRRLTADSAAQLATTQSPAVLAAASDLKVKAAEADVAGLVWRPTVSLQNATNYARGESTSFQAVQRVDEPGVPRGFAEGGYMSNSLVLAVPLYYSGTWLTGETPAAVQAAANQTVAQENLKLQAAQAANLVVKAYFNVLLATEQLALYRIEHGTKTKQLEIVRERVAARLTPRSDQLLVEAALAVALAGINTSNSLLDTNMVQLRSLLGLPDTEKLELAPLAGDAPPVPRLADLINALVDEHPKVRLQQANLEFSRGALLKAKGDYSPVLTFVSSVTGASNLQSGTLPSFTTVGVTLSVPISDFGQSDAKIRAKQEALNVSEQQLAVARSTTRRELANAYHALATATEQIAPAQARLEQLAHAQEVTEARYELGQLPSAVSSRISTTFSSSASPS
jgi:outer membrane protein TolC